MSHESHQCKLVEYFVTHFNEYCTQLFSPFDIICSDESILQQYRQGGHCIYLGLPMYVSMEMNPENGAEIQNVACRRSGIMMRIRVIKSEKNEKEQKDDEDNLPHGAKLLKELVMPWDNTDRIVCADSYLTSVPDAG